MNTVDMANKSNKPIIKDKAFKVVFILPTLMGGGAERVAATLSSEMAHKNISVTFILLYNLPIVYSYHGNVVCLNVKEHKTMVARSYAFIKRFAQIKWLIHKIKPDATISFLEGANLQNLLCSKNPVISVRNFITEQLQDYNFPKVRRWVVKNLYRRAKEIIVVSTSIKNQLVNEYHLPADKITVLYNPIDFDSIKKQSRQKMPNAINKLIGGSDFLITVGSLSPQKAQDYLIEVFALLIELTNKPNLKLIILGEGEMRSKLEALVNRLNLQDKVLLPGFIANPHAIVSRAKLMVMSSRYEGNPNVVWESLVCGTPVVMPNTAGNIPLEQKKHFKLPNEALLTIASVPENQDDKSKQKWKKDFATAIINRLAKPKRSSTSKPYDLFLKELNVANVTANYLTVLKRHAIMR